VIDESYWLIHFVIIDTGNWLPGKKVALTPSWINRFSLTEAKVYVDLPRDFIQNRPEFDLKTLSKLKGVG
jgi:hypothetical protein